MKRYTFKILALFTAITSVILLYLQGLLDPIRLTRAASNLTVFSRDLFPPDFEDIRLLAAAMVETLQIAFLGTVIGFLISLPLAFVSTKTLFPSFVSGVAKSFAGMIRTIPSILLGVIFVIAFGLGTAAGTMAVSVYTVGYLTKIYYEAFEGVDPEVLEAVRGTGANRIQLFTFAVIPESINAILSQLLFMFEYNIRASTIMGFVGAGGIGYYMMGYIQMLNYRGLMTGMILTFIVVMIVDRLSLMLRSQLSVAFK